MNVLASLVLAITGLPALGVAAWYARFDHDLARALALRWALIGLSILCGAIGLYFAGDNRTAGTTVVVAMVVAVNVLVVSLVLKMRRGSRD